MSGTMVALIIFEIAQDSALSEGLDDATLSDCATFECFVSTHKSRESGKDPFFWMLRPQGHRATLSGDS